MVRLMTLVTALVIGLVLAAGLIVTATAGPAAAAAVQCETWTSGTVRRGPAGHTRCTGLTIAQEHRVAVACVENNGHRYSRYGPWRWNHEVSTVSCAEYSSLVGIWVGVKG